MPDESLPDEPYYRRDLALVHHLGFGFHAEMCAPGILELLAPVKERNGLVVEIGCGSGLLTRYLVEAGHRVIASDYSPAMLELAREYAPEVEELRVIALPDDPIPPCDAIVSIGHPINYLSSTDAIDRALVAMAGALRPGGVYAIDICDFEWARARPIPPGQTNVGQGRLGDEWAIINLQSSPSPDRWVREMTTFLRNDDGTWRRDDERHDNVLIDTSRVPALLADQGVDATVRAAFGNETFPAGLVAIVGNKRS